MRKSLRSNRHKLLCELLAEARGRSGLTQEQVADRLGKPQSFIAKTEKGDRRLDVVEFVALTDAMGADAVKILKALRRAKL